MQLAAERSAQTNSTSRSTNEPNAGSLVLGAANEYATAFATLSAQYREQLFRTAHRITRTREDAEDAVQDTLLRAFVHMGDFEGRSNFGTWLTRITINSALMILRKEPASREIVVGRNNNDSGGDDLCCEITDRAPDPETRSAQTEEQRILKTAIRRLRPNLRVVVQIQLQGRSMRETAEALGISLSAAKARLFHAKKALRRSAIRKLVDQPRFAGKLCVSRPGLARRQTPEHSSTIQQSSDWKKGVEDVIEIQGTSERKIPSYLCTTGGVGQDLSSGFAAPRGDQDSRIRNLYGTWRAARP